MTSLHRTGHSKGERLRLLGETDKEGFYRDANDGRRCSLKETDLGHKAGYEEKHLRYVAERLNFSQKEYDELIRSSEKYTGNGKSIFQPEYYRNNRSHKNEGYDKLVSRHNAIKLCSNYREAQRNGQTKQQRPNSQKEESQMKSLSKETEKRKEIRPTNEEKQRVQEKQSPRERGQSKSAASARTASGKAFGNRGTGGKSTGAHGNAGGSGRDPGGGAHGGAGGGAHGGAGGSSGGHGGAGGSGGGHGGAGSSGGGHGGAGGSGGGHGGGH